MARIDELVRAFLALRRIAVVGVSDRRDTGCNMAYRRFKGAGYEVVPVNPRIAEYDGDRCYPDLKSIPERPEGVFILSRPEVTDAVVDEAAVLGIRHVWMHCMMGTRPGLAPRMTSVSPAAVRRCREHGIEVIPGACPNQFLSPDPGHAVMRVLWRTLGFMRVDEAGAGRRSP